MFGVKIAYFHKHGVTFVIFIIRGTKSQYFEKRRKIQFSLNNSLTYFLLDSSMRDDFSPSSFEDNIDASANHKIERKKKNQDR